MSNDEYTTKDSITVDHVLDVLNRMNEVDPVATRELVLMHVACNEDLRDDPTIQVREYKLQDDDPACSVGILGVINGLFGVDGLGWGPITANIKLVCTVGCELPVGRALKIAGRCPICRDRGIEEGKQGTIVFGNVENFRRTPSPEERRNGPPSG